MPKVEAKLSELQAFDPEIRTALTKAETAFKQKNETKQKPAHGPPPLMRRLAINLYYLEQPPPKPVDPQRLAQFFAAMPPWVRTHFDAYPADEARRRLTLVYRLLYPKDEFKPTPAGRGSPTRLDLRQSQLHPFISLSGCTQERVGRPEAASAGGFIAILIDP